MKKHLLSTLVLCGLLAFACPGWSLTMTDVGQVDQFIAAGFCNSGDANEIAWVNATLLANGYSDSFTISDLTKYTAMTWINVEGYDNIYAIDFQTANPMYFYIKTGNLASGDDHFLYKNLAELRWGVIDLAQSGVEINNIGKLSHIGEIGAVPEPATMLLLGSGLLGLAGFARKKFKK